MPGTRRNVLLICCSDGRCRKPNHIREDLVHQIRFPGGNLFPDFCAHSINGSEQTFEMSQNGLDIEMQRLISAITPETGQAIGEIVLLHAIRTMVKLKNPGEIFLAYHNSCGAAQAIGLDEQGIQLKFFAWQQKLRALCPGIDVTILRETHSECGETHHGHVVVTPTLWAVAA
jgi:hypothetical protein